MVKLGIRKPDKRIVQILRKKDNKFCVRPLNSQKTEWLSPSRLKMLEPPERGVQLRLIKNVNFDQECGCTAVVEIRSNRIETFNVYGDIKKYIRSKTRSGSQQTPHHRRVHLQKHGFSRSRGMVHNITGDARLKKIRRYECKQYSIAN